jgi:NADH pyrophosphatase NudC (nudix superfamily)
MNIKSLRDKFGAITEEQGKDLATAMEGKDIAALEAFCKKRGIELAAEEKDEVAEYFKTGKMPLADEELENVAGGACAITDWVNPPPPCPKCGSSNTTNDGNSNVDAKYYFCKDCRTRFLD